ncbi:Gfo/Idh/MocA family oxidoreductase [Pelagibacteraceae bacterium]|nr:Gfo/Idh/MocA family oxidoreductase [Pelagibacteraceae bacterium]
MSVVALFFKRKKFGYRFGVKSEYQFKNNEDFFKCDQIKNIYISTLSNTHHELILKAIDSGKNILCEKPMTLTYEETLEISKKLKSSKVFFMEAIAYRSHPQIDFIIQKLRDNVIGPVREIYSTYGFCIKNEIKKKRLFDLKLGGGAILDIGCYPVSISNLIANINNTKNEIAPEIEDVSGSFHKSGVDEIAYATLNYNNGIKSKIGVAIKHEMENKTIIVGALGKIVISRPWAPEKESFIELYVDGKCTKIDIKSKLDLFSCQIHNVNTSIKKGYLEANYPSMSWKNSVNNMLTLSKWKKLLLNNK